MLPRSRTLPARIYNGVVEERHDVRHYMQVEVQPKAQNSEAQAMKLQATYSKCFDDDGRLKRTGNLTTATSHIITAVIGSGVLSLAWAVAQLGWVAGPIIMSLFALVSLYSSNLLSRCYRTGDPVTGQRNYTYMDAVKANLGGKKVQLCGWIQYGNLFGVAIGYTIAASASMLAIRRSNCYHKHHTKDGCHMSGNGYMITFGIMEILFSQIPDFDQVWWLSIVAAVMCFTYSGVGLALGVAQVACHAPKLGIDTGVVHQPHNRKTTSLGMIRRLSTWSLVSTTLMGTSSYFNSSPKLLSIMSGSTSTRGLDPRCISVAGIRGKHYEFLTCLAAVPIDRAKLA
ncbi:amino acid permease 2-like [Primulina tabacum]|uniref:amino acid permease 2-like n=1 Tax=Primulina tabacum TaxID=48773 RepID=UPI003F5A1E4A